MFDVITYSLCKKLIKDAGKIFSLKGTVTSVNELPLTNNNIGDVYLVGPKSDGSFDEYYWNDAYGWDPIGNTGIEMDGYINDITLYKGADETGTIDNPAEDTIIYTLNNIYAKQEDIMENYVKFTDYATSSKAGTLKSRPSHNFNIGNDGNPYAGNSTIEEYKAKADSTFLSKGTIENIKNNYVKEALQSDEVKEELITQGFVKNSDYATPQTAGLVRTQSDLGIKIGTLGQISVNNADNTEIENKAQQYKPITPSNLDYAVKTSLTTNTIELTEEEKTNAQNWIGITDLVNKVDKKTIDTKNELERVKNDILETGTDTDTYIHLEDSAMAEYQELSVDGVCEQKTTTGKNKLHIKEPQTYTQNGISYTINQDLSITINGNATANSKFSFINKTTLDNTKNYKVVIENFKPGVIEVDFATDKGNKYNYGNLENGTGKISFANLQVPQGTIVNNVTYKIQVIEVDQSSDYEPYTGGQPSPNPDYPQEIKTITDSLNITSCNKNIFDKNDENMFLKDLVPDNKGLISQGTTSISQPNYIKTIIMKCKPNTAYSISKLASKTFYIYESEEIPSVNYQTRLVVGISNLSNYSFTTSKSAKYILFKFYNTWTNELYTYDEILSSVQIEQSSTPTPSEQHLQSQIEANLPKGEFIGKIDDTYKDTLKVEYNEEDGQYHLNLYKNIGKVVLNGSESFNLQSINNYGIANFNYKTGLSPKLIDFNTMSNYFKKQTTSISNTKTEGIYFQYQSEFFLRIESTKVSTVEQFKTWLSTHNTEVYYALETPYVLDLGVVDMPITYDEVTNIFTDSDLMPTINAKYYRNFISTVRNLQVNEKALKQELIDINTRLSALESTQASATQESEVTE